MLLCSVKFRGVIFAMRAFLVLRRCDKGKTKTILAQGNHFLKYSQHAVFYEVTGGPGYFWMGFSMICKSKRFEDRQLAVATAEGYDASSLRPRSR